LIAENKRVLIQMFVAN